jgi:hypothetical protein
MLFIGSILKLGRKDSLIRLKIAEKFTKQNKKKDIDLYSASYTKN